VGDLWGEGEEGSEWAYRYFGDAELSFFESLSYFLNSCGAGLTHETLGFNGGSKTLQVAHHVFAIKGVYQLALAG
jgi:hypothetical protein